MQQHNEPEHWQTLRTTLGANIRATRLQLNISQETLAEKAGLSRNTIIRAEWGKISLTIERLSDIAAALNCTVNDLLTTNAQPPEQIIWKGGRGSMTK